MSNFERIDWWMLLGLTLVVACVIALVVGAILAAS